VKSNFTTELKFVHLLANHLVGFKKTGNNVFNFRCPVCGDSKKKRMKKRGYIFEKNGKLVFYCHNCSITKGFPNFLKEQSELLYQEFLMECLNGSGKEVQEKTPIQIKTDALIRLPKVSSLSPEHPCKKYVISRLIPTTYHHKLFFAARFKTFVNSLIPNKFTDIGTDEPRLVIPIYSEGKLIGFQGRALSSSEVKYISIVLDETKGPLIYGLDDINWNKKVYVFEGPIDSMFIPNSVAICGSSLIKAAQHLNKRKNNMILVFDNEPRNSEIVKSIKRAITMGFFVCIFPVTFKFKDIGEAIQALVSQREFVDTEEIKRLGLKLKEMIDVNTYHGLNAELRLAEWSKI